MEINRFNVRVYGICIQDGKLLLTDEIRGGSKMTKLPGGGVDLGEGVVDALIREFQEEMNVEIHVGELFYLNPFLQISGFRPSDQVISIYYFVRLLEESDAHFTHKPFDFEPDADNVQCFRWVHLDNLTVEDMTYLTDKSMLAQLKAFYKG